ncbi:MAG: DUF1361 domain-containing protein [Tissierellia bacterium]|nr:DUF1361 domain-containing protein [Tissierellia bacterium]
MKIKYHVIYLIIFAILSMGVLLYGNGNLLNLILIWNMILALIPLIAANLVKKRKGLVVYLSSFLWLIFLPNAFYIVTDFIHLSQRSFYTIQRQMYDIKVQYHPKIALWWDLFLILAVFLYGAYCGIKSEHLMEKRLGLEFYSKEIFRIIIGFLCGVGIYIGRFMRLNSWDIFNIGKYIETFQTLGHPPGFVFGFILLFTLYIYVVLHIPLEKERN